MRADQYIGVSDEYKYANASGADDAKAKVEQAEEAKAQAERALGEYEGRLSIQNAELEKLYSDKDNYERLKDAAIAEKSRLNSVRYNQGSSGQRAIGEACKKAFGMAGAWDGGCLTRNTQRQNTQQELADKYAKEFNRVNDEIISQEKKILATEKDLQAIEVNIGSLRAELFRAKATYQDALALNNTEALKARAELEEASRQREVDRQQKLNELEQLKNQAATEAQQAALKDSLITQESQALQASADLQKSSMPMVVGFIGLVVLSFIIQPMLKKKQ